METNKKILAYSSGLVAGLTLGTISLLNNNKNFIIGGFCFLIILNVFGVFRKVK